MNLFNLEPEKYYDFPASYNKEKIHALIDEAVFSGNYFVSEKLDGNWARFVCQDGIMKIQTRGISKKTKEYGEIQDKVPHIFDDLVEIVGGDTMIIGEIYLPKGNDKDVGSILRCLTSKAISRQEEEKNKLHFCIFDIWYLNGQSMMETRFESRVKIMLKWFKDSLLINHPYIHLTKFYSGEKTYELLDKVVEDGGEGVVMQKKDGRPEPGKRPTRKSIKIKRNIAIPVDVFCSGFCPAIREYTGKEVEKWNLWENTKTGKIVNENKFKDFLNGEPWEAITKGYYFGWPGSILCSVWRNGKEVHVCKVSGLSDALKQEIKDNLETFIGRPMIISGMEFTTDGSIRHPEFLGFRDDISNNDCTWEKIFG